MTTQAKEMAFELLQLTWDPFAERANAQSYPPFAENPNPLQVTEPLGARYVPPISIAPLVLYSV